MADVPFWETLIASVLASGALSALLTTGAERRKRNTELQLERLEKAIGMLRSHFQELDALVDEFMLDPDSAKNKELEPKIAPMDLQVAITMCAPYLDEEVRKYFAAKVVIVTSIGLYTNRSDRTKERLTDSVIQALDRLKRQHDLIATALLSRCHRLIGVGRKWAWLQFKQSYSDFSCQFWGLERRFDVVKEPPIPRPPNWLKDDSAAPKPPAST